MQEPEPVAALERVHAPALLKLVDHNGTIAGDGCGCVVKRWGRGDGDVECSLADVVSRVAAVQGGYSVDTGAHSGRSVVERTAT